MAPYPARPSVSTQLVVNGLHPLIKDQIMGHAADDMSRLYTSVPQPKLIEAINTLPTFPDWLNADWMKTPVTLTARRAKMLSKAERDAGTRAFEEWRARRAA